MCFSSHFLLKNDLWAEGGGVSGGGVRETPAPTQDPPRLLRVASGLSHFFRDLSEQLHALRQVVLVSLVPVAGSGVK